MRKYLLLLIATHAQVLHAQTDSLPTVPVTTKPLNQVLIERRLTANAQVMARNDAQLSSEVTAVVEAINAELGDAVQAGEVLLQLDETDYRLQLDQARANSQAAQARLTQAELRLKRANELQQSQYISADDLLSRETDVAVLKADLLRLQVAERAATRNLNKTTINAPFDGVVTARQAQQGQLLLPGSPVLKLTQTEGRQIHAKIPTQLADQLATADRTLFQFDGQQIPVELIKLSDVVDNQAAIRTARFSSSAAAPIGQTGQVIWYLEGQLLSADLVLKRAGKLGVFVAENGQARFKVLPDAQEGRPVPMATTPDWQVIIGGRERLQDGQSIRVK